MTATAAPAATHATIAIAKIVPHPRNPRRDIGDVTDLAASIAEVGILQDLVVAPWPAGLGVKKPRGAEYVLIAGHRRHAGAKAANLKDVPVKIRTDLDTLSKQLEAALVENLQRSDLTPVEEADTYQALLDLEGLTQTALAKSVGQPVSRVRERLKLARLDQPVKEKVHTGQLTIGDAIAVASFADDEVTTKTLVKEIGTSNFRHTLERAERDRKAAVELDKKLKPYRDAGVTIADHSSWNLPKGWKKISDITGNGGYLGEDEKIAWDAEHHAKCPGRVVLASTYSSLDFACSDGSLHPRPKVQKSAAEVKREKEDKQRRAEFAPSSAAATAVRRRHIAACLAAATSTQADRARSYLFEDLLVGGHWWSDKDEAKRRALLAEILGTNLDPDADADAQVKTLEGAADRLTVEGLVLLHWVIKRHGSAEEKLADIPKDGRWYGPELGWVRELSVVFGYEWSDWERETFHVDFALRDDDPAEGGDES